jgi:hypothetical protein
VFNATVVELVALIPPAANVVAPPPELNPPLGLPPDESAQDDVPPDSTRLWLAPPLPALSDSWSAQNPLSQLSG